MAIAAEKTQQMMNDDLKWVELKATLRFVEEKILRITEINGWESTKELYEQVKDLLNDRHYILNKMFQLHVTEQEVERFREVNAHLLELTHEMFDEHLKILKFLEENHFDGSIPACDIEVDSQMDVDEGGLLHLFDDDTDYGSNFSKMADAIAWTEDLEIHSCSTYLEEEPFLHRLDDGTTWAEGCLDLPQFKDIVVCYAVHDLCTHKNYSVPDLLRLQSYTIRHSINTKQDYTVWHNLSSMVNSQ